MEKTLNIYYTSDIHGYLYPETYADRRETPLALFAAMSGFQKDGNTLLLDGGDMLQGSAFDLYCQKYLCESTAQAEAMNAAGYDFVTLGNHDFNYGYQYLTHYLKKLSAKAVCANVKIKNKEDADLVKPYEIVTLENGLRVAVIGIVTDHVKVWEKPEHLEPFEISDPFAALSAALSEIGSRADLKVCIYHGGYEADLETGEILSTTGEDAGYRICRELPVDILLTGHQHLALSGKWINGTFTAQTPDRAQKYLRLSAALTGHGLDVRSELIQTALPDEKRPFTEAAERARRALMPIEEAVQTWLDTPLGHLSRPLLPDTKIRMAKNGSPIADFINRIQLHYSGAQLSCCSLSNDVSGFQKDVTTRDVIASYPYPNTLLVLEIDGKTLRAALERAAGYFSLKETGDDQLDISQDFLKPKTEHYHYDYFMGITYTFDIRSPIGERVVSLCYEGRPVKPDDRFRLCLNSYRASGAGGYGMYRGLKVLKEISAEMTELIIDYLEQQREIEIQDTKTVNVVY